jgi:hypothetical protein
MAKTNAERQKEYRKNRQVSGVDNNGEHQLNTWISTGATLALERLAFRYGVTKKEVLEKLIKNEDGKILAMLELDSQEWNDYQNPSKKTIVTE